MRKLVCVLTVLCLLAPLAACSSLKEPVSFYYPRQYDAIAYGEEAGFISPEEREASGHWGDLSYLLALYLAGPLSEELVNPFPAGTLLENLVLHQDSIVIVLSGEFSQLSGVELTVACTCIASTCFELSEANEITIISDETELHSQVHITLTRDSILFSDDSLPLPEGSGEE